METKSKKFNNKKNVNYGLTFRTTLLDNQKSSFLIITIP